MPVSPRLRTSASNNVVVNRSLCILGLSPLIQTPNRSLKPNSKPAARRGAVKLTTEKLHAHATALAVAGPPVSGSTASSLRLHEALPAVAPARASTAPFRNVQPRRPAIQPAPAWLPESDGLPPGSPPENPPRAPSPLRSADCASATPTDRLREIVRLLPGSWLSTPHPWCRLGLNPLCLRMSCEYFSRDAADHIFRGQFQGCASVPLHLVQNIQRTR